MITPGGALIAIGHPPDQEKAVQHGVRAMSTIAPQGVADRDTTEPPQTISRLLESGELLPQPGKVFPLEEAAQAQSFSETGHGRGRIILHIADE